MKVRQYIESTRFFGHKEGFVPIVLRGVVLLETIDNTGTR